MFEKTKAFFKNVKEKLSKTSDSLTSSITEVFKVKVKVDEKVLENYCILKEPLAISYALSIAIAGRAKSISLAGFDGSAGLGTYKDNTNSILKNFRKLNKNINLTTLTPSKYKIRKLAI